MESPIFTQKELYEKLAEIKCNILPEKAFFSELISIAFSDDGSIESINRNIHSMWIKCEDRLLALVSESKELPEDEKNNIIYDCVSELDKTWRRVKRTLRAAGHDIIKLDGFIKCLQYRYPDLDKAIGRNIYK